METDTVPYAGRVAVPELDKFLGVQINALNDGFVRAVDYMGGDASVVQAARISYGAGTKTPSDDAHLIRFLMRHHHDTPFEMATLKVHMRIPMDAWRQFVRHRLLSINEYSTRYSEAIDSAQVTLPQDWREQATTNRQGSGNKLSADIGLELSAKEAQLHLLSREVYEGRLKVGVAREQARKDLPLSTYTEVYVECDLRGWLHFLGLRMAPDAQWEIRQYANAIAGIVLRWAPISWSAFEDFRLNCISLSARDIEAIRAVQEWNRGGTAPWQAIGPKLESWGWFKKIEEGVYERTKAREMIEFVDKAHRLKVDLPKSWTIAA